MGRGNKHCGRTKSYACDTVYQTSTKYCKMQTEICLDANL